MLKKDIYCTLSSVTSHFTETDNSPANNVNAKTKCFVIVTACTEASLHRVLTFTHFIIMLIILSEPIIMY